MYKDVKTNAGMQTLEQLTFRTTYSFMWAGVALVFVGLVEIVPLFWGFWEVKEEVTLDPMEIVFQPRGTTAHIWRSRIRFF